MLEQQHFHQCDGVLLSPLEIYLWTWHKWQLNFADLYKMNTQVLLNFTTKLGIGHFEGKIVEDWLKDHDEERYCDYKARFSPDKLPNSEEAPVDADIES